MNKLQIDLLIKVLMGISAFITVLGTFLKITHNENGQLIFMIGIVSFVIIMTFDQIHLSKGK